jgi:hypothetical protein
MMRKTFLAALGLGGAQTAGISAAVVDDTIRQALTDKPRANPDGSFYLPSTPETITWGHLPNASSTPALTVPSGATVTIDTLSHEGLLEDQGKDPLAYFGHLGIPRAQILEEAIAIAALPHDFGRDGPHVVTGPIAIEGARPGDWLRIETVRLESRVPYGIISNRHGKGALPGEYPTKAAAAHPNAAHPETYGNVSVLARAVAGQGEIATARGPIRFPLAPFVGLMGIAPHTTEPVHSVPPVATLVTTRARMSWSDHSSMTFSRTSRRREIPIELMMRVAPRSKRRMRCPSVSRRIASSAMASPASLLM